MCCAIHAAPHTAAGATGAQSCFVQYATCEFAFSHDIESMSSLCKICKFYFVLFVPLLFALHCFACAVFALLVDKAGVLHNCKFCSCNKANVFCRCKMQLFPWNSHLPCHSPFFSPAVRPCTIEDSAFTCAISYVTGSLPAAALLHSAPFSLPPCYFGA